MENRGEKDQDLYYIITGCHCEVPDEVGYFHASYRQEHPIQKGRSYTIIDGIQGKGQFVGGLYSGMYAIYGDNREFYNGQQRFLLYRFHIADQIHFETKFRMTLDNLGWTGPRYDDYTSCAYWYQTLPSAPLKPLPSDKEMIMK